MKSWLWFIALCLSACAPAVSALAPTSAPAVSATRVAPAVGAPTVTRPPAFTPTPARATPRPHQPPETAPEEPTTCTETTGAVTVIGIPSDRLNYALSATVYLPPCYASLTRHYPVIYLLHGLGYYHDQWARLGMPAAADDLLARGRIGPVILVMPRDPAQDFYPDVMAQEIVPFVDATYRTLADRRYRAIGGLSRGGGWAVHIGLKYAALFGKIGLHSPAVFYQDEYDLLRWAREAQKNAPQQVYIDVGDGDANPQSARWLNQVFTWFNTPVTYIVQPGAHVERYWAKHTPDYLLFYAGDWVAAPESLTLPAPAD